MSGSNGPAKSRLYSEDEVANPGYPGALLMLGVPVLLLGVALVTEGIIHGEVRSVGGLVSVALVALVFVVPGMMLIRKAVMARRAQRREAWKYRPSDPPGVCPACAYNRSGLAADAVCPECGAPAPFSSPPRPAAPL